MAQSRSRILIMTEPTTSGTLFCRSAQSSGCFVFAIERDRARRIVNRIAAENEELLDPAGIDIARQLQNAVRRSASAANSRTSNVVPSFSARR